MTSHPLRALVALAALFLVGHAPPAAACYNEVLRETVPSIKTMTLAEQQIGAGETERAVTAILKLQPKARAETRLIGRGEFGLDPMAARAQRLVAVAVVRDEGLLTIDEFPAATADDRRRNLEWAIGILRAFAKVKGGPAVETDLGEALSKLPETRAEALSILSRLEQKDLVTTPEGYAALADLRLAAGDRAGHEAARKRYEAMRRKADGREARAKGKG